MQYGWVPLILLLGGTGLFILWEAFLEVRRAKVSREIRRTWKINGEPKAGPQSRGFIVSHAPSEKLESPRAPHSDSERRDRAMALSAMSFIGVPTTAQEIAERALQLESQLDPT